MLTIQLKGYSTINNGAAFVEIILDAHDLNHPMKCIKNFKACIKGNFFNQAELKYTVT